MLGSTASERVKTTVDPRRSTAEIFEAAEADERLSEWASRPLIAVWDGYVGFGRSG